MDEDQAAPTRAVSAIEGIFVRAGCEGALSVEAIDGNGVFGLWAAEPRGAWTGFLLVSGLTLLALRPARRPE